MNRNHNPSCRNPIIGPSSEQSVSLGITEEEARLYHPIRGLLFLSLEMASPTLMTSAENSQASKSFFYLPTFSIFSDARNHGIWSERHNFALLICSLNFCLFGGGDILLLSNSLESSLHFLKEWFVEYFAKE